jgi:hypothetical protein
MEMPNTPVRAAAEGMPSINRRRAMLGAGAAIAALAATTLPAEPATADAELIRLGQELDRLRPEFIPLKAVSSRLQQVWLDECHRLGVSLDADASHAFAEEIGLRAAERRVEPLETALGRTADAILAASATTLAGLAVKAKALRLEVLPYRPELEAKAEYEEMDWDDEVVLRFMFDIERLAGAVS